MSKLVTSALVLLATLYVNVSCADPLPVALDLDSLVLIGQSLSTPLASADNDLVNRGAQTIATWRQAHPDEWNKIVASGKSSYATLAALPAWSNPNDGKEFVAALIRVTSAAQVVSSGDQLLKNYMAQYDTLKKLTDAVLTIRNEVPALNQQVNSLSKAEKDAVLGATRAFGKATQ
ncbi:hypothetical protein [Bradyrhizobium sp. SK17]|uniref:hypothetical protein n=1 Tax=Bradyrhizobium sp. SK17 TaxID=2057741 RepID=UPI0012FE14C0|nr:hypothetical protein [Bradyrhizobium sp. SK17]